MGVTVTNNVIGQVQGHLVSLEEGKMFVDVLYVSLLTQVFGVFSMDMVKENMCETSLEAYGGVQLAKMEEKVSLRED